MFPQTLILPFAQIGLAGLIALSQLSPLPAGTPATANTSGTPTVETNAKALTPSEEMQALIAQIARDEHVSVKTMLAIARCESTFRQFDENGAVLRGTHNPKDVGLFQINEEYHLEDSEAEGFDIHTAEGNARFAAHLLKEKGTSPWNWSKPCWGKELSAE